MRPNAVLAVACGLLASGVAAARDQKRGSQVVCPPESAQCDMLGWSDRSVEAPKLPPSPIKPQGASAPQSPAARYEEQTHSADVDRSRPAPTVIRLPLQIRADPAGHFWTDAEINGKRISGVLIDTGATFVVLTSQDAAAAGLSPDPSEYTHWTSTANGLARVAKAKLRHVRVGDITISDVDALVAQPGALRNSLMGMAFLSKLSRFTVDSGTLTLRR